MSLATLFVVPAGLDSIREFTFANQERHIAAGVAIQRKHSITITGYALDPVPAGALSTFLLNHQASHNQINGILGTAGNDLTSLNFEDENSVREWIWLHASEHRTWDQTLGI